MLTLERISLEDADWRRMDTMADRVIFQTHEWLQFVAGSQNAEPVLAAVLDDGRPVGYFTGLVIRRFGVRILGSPFPGWTTPYMGFNLTPGVSRYEAVAALVRFAYGPMRCMHLELCDRHLGTDDFADLRFENHPAATLEVDLADDEGVILGRMSSSKRWAIRKAERLDVRAEVATGTAFADEYHKQLRDVFAKQSLVPTYDVERVRELIRCLEPTGRLLLVRCRAPDGRSIATALFPAYNGTAYYWGGASFRADQNLRPNEAIFWFAIRYWRERGMTTLDLGGTRDYKRSYGGQEVWLSSLRRSRLPGLAAMRGFAQSAVKWRQTRAGRRATTVQ